MLFATPEGERGKTVDNCFYEAKSTKQGVWGFKGTKNPQTTMRLDRYENAVCKANCSCPTGTQKNGKAGYYICLCFATPEGERGKTVDNCFYEAKSTKQGEWGIQERK